MKTLLKYLIAVLFFCFSFPLFAQKSQDLDSLHFLVGSWAGRGTGEPGQGIGEFSFNLDLQGKVLVRKSFAEYPAEKDKPAYRHDDMTIIYKDAGGQTKAIYFDNEGHVINYAVSFSDDGKSLVFLSDYTDSSPRFRLTYTSVGGGSLKIKFDIAPPGKPYNFAPYIDAVADKE